MEIIRWIISIIIGCLSMWIGLMNWATIIAVVRHNKTASLAPFFGAVGMIIALIIMPSHKSWWMYILPLVIDYSCLPGITNKIIAKIKSRVSE